MSRTEGADKVIAEAGYRRAFEKGTHDPNAELRPLVRAGKQVLNVHRDARGGLVELWRQSWEGLTDDDVEEGHVRQVYLSETLPGVVKAWHLHLHQWDRFTVVRGRILIATFDLLESEQVTERVLDANTPELVVVEPLVAHGWMTLGNEPSTVLNLCSREYSGRDEYRRDPTLYGGPSAIGPDYDWRRRRDG